MLGAKIIINGTVTPNMTLFKLEWTFRKTSEPIIFGLGFSFDWKVFKICTEILRSQRSFLTSQRQILGEKVRLRAIIFRNMVMICKDHGQAPDIGSVPHNCLWRRCRSLCHRLLRVEIVGSATISQILGRELEE